MHTEKLTEIAKKAYIEAPSFWDMDRVIGSMVLCITAEIQRQLSQNQPERQADMTAPSKETGGPAFPCRERQEGRIWLGPSDGMTLRDYFATSSLNAFLTWSGAQDISAEVHARAAYDLADAMLKVRAES